MARRILLAVASLPAEVFLKDVRRVVQSLSLGDYDAGRFRSAIGMVEGTFIDIREAIPGSGGRERLVVVRDPSVRDYLWARLEAVDGEAEALLEHAVFFEQCVILYKGRNHATWMRTASLSRSRDVVNHEAVVRRAVELIDSTSPVVHRKYEDSENFHFRREPMNLERRTAFLMDVFAAHKNSQVVAGLANSALTATIGEWEAGRGLSNDGLSILNQAVKVEDLLKKGVLERAERALHGLITNRLQRKEDFEALVALSTQHPGLFEEPQRDLKSWGSEFGDFIEDQRDWLLLEIDDPDWIEEEMRVIRRIAEAFEMDISELEADAEYRIGELPIEWEPDSEDDIPELYSNPREESEEEEMDALFQSLRWTLDLDCN